MEDNKKRLAQCKQDFVQALMAIPELLGQGLESDDKFACDDAKGIVERHSFIVSEIRGAKESGASINPEFVDALIAQWGKAGLLRHMPELIDSADENIQADIADLLENVFLRLKHYQSEDERVLVLGTSGFTIKKTPEERILNMRITKLSSLLLDAQKLVKSGIYPALELEDL